MKKRFGKGRAGWVDLFCLSTFLFGHLAQAAEVPWGYHLVARAHEIPPEILYAVALQESGMRTQSGAIRPWPWTLNVEGRPKRYASRMQAWSALKEHIQHGKTLVDVGIMQVNWRYHKHKLVDAWRALDPYHNLKVGAQILHQRHTEDQDWPTAIGRYHSPGDTQDRRMRARQYSNKVMIHLGRL